MRALTAQETALLALGSWSTWVMVEIESTYGGGTYQNLAALAGYDWVLDVTYRQNVDDPVASCTVTLQREQQPLGHGTVPLCLSPFVESSQLNRIAGVYEPMLDVNKRMRVSVAMLPILTTPGCDAYPATFTAVVYHLVFDGYVDAIDVGSETIKVDCRDIGSLVQDRFIEIDAVYGDVDGSPVETEMQAMLDAELGASVVDLYTPTSPSWNVYLWLQQKEPLGQAINKLAQQIGWDVRYKWREDEERFDLTLWSPDRAKAVPDVTLGAGQYMALPRMAISRAGIRNAIRVEYTDRATAVRQSHTKTDATSITRYGRRWMAIGEASTSAINSESEAEDLCDALLSDLKDPVAEQSCKMPYLYALEVADLVRFSANGVHFDTDQDLAVTSIEHSIGKDKATTTVAVRGSPSGGYERWLALDCRTGLAPSSLLRVSRTTEWSSSANDSWESVTSWTTVEVDDALQWDVDNDQAIITQSGIYAITAEAPIKFGAGGTAVLLGLAVDDVVVAQFAPDVQEMLSKAGAVFWRGRLVTGQTVKMQVYGAGSTNVYITMGTGSGNTCYMSIQKVPE